MCASCGHVVSEHKHEFWIEEGYQVKEDERTLLIGYMYNA